MGDYEKKYKEALETARGNYKAAFDIGKDTKITVECFKNTLTHIFPELKESEDERIKRILHSILSKISFHLHDIFTEEEFQCFDAWSNAWLKKQDEKVDVEVIDKFDTEFEKQVSHLVAAVISKEYKYTEGFIKWASNSLLGYAKHELEKQTGKPQGKSALEAIKEEKVDNTNKVEPKFHKGDWVVSNYDGKINQVEDVTKDDYGFYLKDRYSYFCGSYWNEFRLWAIKDVKDGDILVNDSCALIFQKWMGSTLAHAHCILDFEDDDDFEVDTTVYIESDDDVSKPATKEQRDLLFQKLKEKGYEWDEKNKKLIKI